MVGRMGMKPNRLVATIEIEDARVVIWDVGGHVICVFGYIML